MSHVIYINIQKGQEVHWWNKEDVATVKQKKIAQRPQPQKSGQNLAQTQNCKNSTL